MFGIKKAVKDAINEVMSKDKDATAMKLEIKKLKEELEDLKLQKKMEETEIKHLVKCKEEKAAIDAERQKNELAKTFNEKEMALQTKYHDKVMGVIENEHKKIQELYKEILGRLPDVNMTITKKC